MHLERARRLAPQNAQTLYNLSGAYALTNRFNDARSTLNALFQVDPDHAAGRQLQASLPGS